MYSRSRLLEIAVSTVVFDGIQRCLRILIWYFLILYLVLLLLLLLLLQSTHHHLKQMLPSLVFRILNPNML